MPREHIEEPGISPKEKVGRIAEGLAHIDNTAQLSWLIELSRELFGFEASVSTARTGKPSTTRRLPR